AAGLDAPATAKNVISVGAIKNLRYITNEVVKAGETNQPWLRLTDTNNEIAPFSSLGNVGRGREGATGRFKPDVVAPGTFVVSTRSSLWSVPSNDTSVVTQRNPFEVLRPKGTKPYSTFIDDNALQLEITLVTNEFTGPGGLPPLPIYVQAGTPPV